MEASPSDSPLLPEHIWHHRVHEETGESLYFWRLAFSPVYIRDSALAGLKAALARCKVRSVALYELLGPFDMLVRVWLPKGREAEEFQRVLDEELRPHGLDMLESFAVEYVVRHWAFSGKRVAEPDAQSTHELLRDKSRIRDLEDGQLDFKGVQALIDDHLVAVPKYKNRERPGIKFAIIVTGNSATASREIGRVSGLKIESPILVGEERHRFEERVTKVVADAKSLGDRSLYAGNGFGHFVILGRTPNKHFHDIHSQLVTQLGAAPLREQFSVSTVTLISGQRGLRLFSESLLRSPYVVHTPAVTPNTVPLDGLQEGARFATRFEIVESLGAGNYGVVYKVSDHEEQGYERALKLFSSDRESSEAAQRELEMLRKVKSEHVVDMIWGGQDSETGWWYLVSEFVDGIELEDYVRGLRAGQLSDDESVEIVRQILLGLESIHPRDEKMDELAAINDERELTEEEWREWQKLKDQGIVHRDIKPSNVMITASGVKLIDFNIASPAGSQIQTQRRTPNYAPPGGWPESIWAPRVDLFATGVVLYELLCNAAHPYPNGSDQFVDPATHRPDLNSETLDIIRQACQVATVYPRASEMREALENAWQPTDSAG